LQRKAAIGILKGAEHNSHGWHDQEKRDENRKWRKAKPMPG
jgi:hypothetical protein